MSESEDVMASRQLAAKELASRDFRRQLDGYGLTTAEILYRLPDHPSLLQTYVWQDYDLHPRFPRLMQFLSFWSRNLECELFRVRVPHKRLITPAEWRLYRTEFALNCPLHRRPPAAACPGAQQ